MTRLVLATQNEHKVHELRQILADLVDELGLEIVGAADVPDAPDVVESEVTFDGNARLKAVARRRGHRPAERRRRLRPRRRRPRWVARASSRRAGRARTPAPTPRAPCATAPTSRSCSSRSATCPTSTGPRRSSAPPSLAMPDGSVESVEGRVTGTIRRDPLGDERLRLRPDLRAGRRHPLAGRVHRRREERDLAPGPRLPRHGADPARAPHQLTSAILVVPPVAPVITDGCQRGSNPHAEARHPKCLVSTHSTTLASGCT